jgi:hypothetical protein
MAIFGTAIGTAGEVMTIPGSTTPALISVPGLGTGQGVAITSVGFSQDANVQFMHSLRRLIYVYSFGERMGVVEINGVSFYRPCNSGGGIGDVLNFYRDNSVARKSDLTSVTLAGGNIRGFVRGVRSTFADADKGVIGFSLIISTMPDIWG